MPSTTLKWNGEEAKVKGYNTIKKSAIEMGLIMQGQAVKLCPADTARLRKSIIVQSKETQYGSPAEASDAIAKPEDDLEVHVGTNVNYSWNVEFGTGPHLTDDGSEEFVANMLEWCRINGIDDPWAVIQAIRKRGTKAQPFLRPAFDLSVGKTLSVLRKNGEQEFKEYAK